MPLTRRAEDGAAGAPAARTPSTSAIAKAMRSGIRGVRAVRSYPGHRADRLPAYEILTSTRALGPLPVRRDAATQKDAQRGHRRPGNEQVVVGEPGARHAHAQTAEQGERQPGELHGERRLVDAAGARERDARAEPDEVEQPARVAEQPVRDELEGVERPDAAQHF